MWPRTLDITVDECRVLMRKLEVETYACVMNTFRAQGSLSQQKLNLLADLRNLLKIGQDRHRAETRRATNDELLSTIAEKLFGDDCIIQWTREGKRGAPLLCRTKAYTTLSITADEAAAYVRRLNRKLPAPSKVKRQAAALPPPHEFESQTVARNVVVADPLRAHPLPRPSSIAPLLPEGSSVIQRNADMTATKVPASDTQKITRDYPPQKREMNPPHIRQLREQNQSVTITNTPVSTKKNIPGKIPAGSKMKTLVSTPSDPRIQKVPHKMSGPRKRNATQLEIPTRNPDAFKPMVAKSKKDITSNVLKMNHSQPPYSAASTHVNVPIPPATFNQKEKPMKPLRRSIGSKKSPSVESQNVLVPPPPKVQIIDQTIAKPAVVPSNGSILYNHLQRKIPPKSLAVQAPLNGASKKRADSVDAVMDDSVQRISHSCRVGEFALSKATEDFETEVAEERPREAQITGTRIVAGPEIEHEEILMEDEEEVVVDLSDDKIIYDMNDSAEIIEEDDGGEFLEEVYEEPVNGSADYREIAEEQQLNDTDYEYLLDSGGVTTVANEEILLEEMDSESVQFRKTNLNELLQG